MTIAQQMQDGEFAEALVALGELNAVAPEPANLLMAFNLEVRLQRFEAAADSMRRLVELAPQVAGPMSVLASNARAEQAATVRRSNPEAAGQRAGIGAPPPHAMALINAAVLHAQGDGEGAAAALAEAKALTPVASGTLTWRNGKTARFHDLVDSDELTGPILPCYDGDTVLDLPYSQLRAITFHDLRSSFDAMWVPADVMLATGKTILLKVPAYYVGTGVSEEPMVRTGRTTMWDYEHDYAEAIGQRDFKLLNAAGGATMVGILQVQRIELD